MPTAGGNVKQKAIVLLVLALLTGLTAVASEFPVIVSQIEVSGNVNVNENEILREVPFAAGEEITADELKAAAQAIFGLGWFAGVVPEFDASNVLTFKVEEYPVIEEINVSGNEATDDFKILGLTIFRSKIMPTNKAHSILRENGVRRGAVLNRNLLKDGVQAIIDAYEDQGYTLVRIGNVTPGERLSIEIIEGKITDNIVKGLSTVPQDIAHDMIDLPKEKCIKKAAIQAVMSRLRESVFFSSVSIIPQQGQTKDSVQLVWEMTEREILDTSAEIRQIKLSGVTRFPPSTAYTTLGEIPEGPINNYGLLQVLEGLFDLYYREGYVMVRFETSSLTDGILSIDVKEGEIGKVNITGNDYTEDYVIDKVFDIRPGQILNQDRLAVTYQQMMALGYFKSIDINPTWIGDRIELSVSLVEQDELGGINGSVSLSPRSGGLVGKLSYSQKNLFGTGQDLSFSYNRGLINDESATWSIGYSTVAFFPAFDRVGANLYRRTDKKTVNEQETNVYTVGGTGSVSYPVADYTNLTLSYKHEATRVGDPSVWSPIDSVTTGVSYDDVANPRFPTSGDRRSVSVEKAGGFAPGPQYTKLNASWINFSSLSINLPFLAERDQAFAIRLAGGWGINIPYSQAYDLGGPETIRGTSALSVPRLAYANFEYRLAVVEGLTTSLFFDVGTVLPRVNLLTTLGSFGIELGIKAAGMYVRLDMAWVIGPDIDWVPNFNFGFSPMF
jgi:outer membrane protein assembly factor BamA